MTKEKIVVPDFGDVQTITVVDVYVSVGDEVAVDDSLIALESEKAVMDIPSPFAGIIKEVLIKENDITKSGDLIALIEVANLSNTDVEIEKEVEVPVVEIKDEKMIFHATPSVRAYARQHGIDLAAVAPTGPNDRILLQDMQQRTTVPEPVLEDFSKYGELEEVAIGRIQKISGPHLQKNWQTIPHVTHFDEADITELENFRKELNRDLQEGEMRFGILGFIIKAVVAVLQEFPLFNSSLSQTGDKIILKKYYHIGIAVDTSEGLMVPVLKDVESKGIKQLGTELSQLSFNARQGKLAIPDIQGATFTISSLGGIGGTGFTPIVNGPQVAILGLSRSYQKPVWDGDKFVPRLTLPFSVSYDHRVIDGAEAARFCKVLAQDIRELKRTLL